MPQYTSFHPYSNVKIRMLDCTSNLTPSISNKSMENKEISDEADDFHNNPIGWLYENWNENGLNNTNIIIVYEKIYKKIQTFLQGKFKVENEIFHSHFLTSSRQDHKILILEKI